MRPTDLILPALVVLAGLIPLLGGCSGEEFSLDPDLGGGTTRAEASRNSFGLPAPQLTNEQRRTFEVGDSFFTQNWVSAPASTEARDGLGAHLQCSGVLIVPPARRSGARLPIPQARRCASAC